MFHKIEIIFWNKFKKYFIPSLPFHREFFDNKDPKNNSKTARALIGMGYIITEKVLSQKCTV